jgi:uncharacterized protein YdgA (DUF945 family)
MKRWVVFLLVFLAVIILVSPGIVGHLAERNLKDSISWAERERPDIRVTEETFDRGWFTAEGRHRVELKRGELRTRISQIAGGDARDRIPALIVDTRIDHGLVPFTSMSRRAGSLMPALASTVSTLHLDTGAGELVDIPGMLFSQVSLSGTTSTRYLLEPGSFDGDDADVEWQHADVSLATDASHRELTYEGRIEPLSLQSGDRFAAIGHTNFEGESRYTSFGFMVGAVALEVEALSFRNAGGQAIDIGSLELDADSDIIDERVSAKTSLTIGRLSLPDVGDVGLSMDVAANGLDALSMQGIIAEVQAAQRAPDPQAALQALYPRIEGDLRNMLSSGAEFRIDRFDVTLPQGEVTTRLRLQLPETDRAGEFSWAALLLSLTASADFRVPVALMEMAQAANPQSGALVAMGILKQDGDSYVVNAQYEKGLLTVNGAPMPIPLPGR